MCNVITHKGYKDLYCFINRTTLIHLIIANVSKDLPFEGKMF